MRRTESITSRAASKAIMGCRVSCAVFAHRILNLHRARGRTLQRKTSPPISSVSKTTRCSRAGLEKGRLAMRGQLLGSMIRVAVVADDAGGVMTMWLTDTPGQAQNQAA